MEIISSHKGESIKTAVVKFPKPIAGKLSAHEAAATFAMKHFGETPDRLMDWDTDRYDEDDRITVRLYTR